MMYKVPNHVNSIDFFRDDRFRVFLASSYFGIDIPYEIKWHEKHLKTLRLYKKNPLKYHQNRGHKEIDERKIKHHKEWVLDSIPFHQKFIEEHKEKLKTILSIMPKKVYNKIVKISLEKIYISNKIIPEYFVYHKKTKTFFFVSEHSIDSRNHWIYLVRDKYKFCDVVVLNTVS